MFWGDRVARRLTCLVDGDTGWELGTKWRLLDIDTPETIEAECDREKEIGERAKLRLQSLMSRDTGSSTAEGRIGLPTAAPS